jgi:hypothetical protein
MSRIASRATSLVGSNDGQAAPEYAVVLAVVASTAAFLFAVLGNRVVEALNVVVGLLP